MVRMISFLIDSKKKHLKFFVGGGGVVHSMFRRFNLPPFGVQVMHKLSPSSPTSPSSSGTKLLVLENVFRQQWLRAYA